mmetsp:Transcript_54860/g.111984  ORF Transcript_54860/g.111984 Transcript_54860/m.111984 type:complete len:248 (+) Transcript_54860:370-1113(+)
MYTPLLLGHVTGLVELARQAAHFGRRNDPVERELCTRDDDDEEVDGDEDVRDGRADGAVKRIGDDHDAEEEIEAHDERSDCLQLQKRPICHGLVKHDEEEKAERDEETKPHLARGGFEAEDDECGHEQLVEHHHRLEPPNFGAVGQEEEAKAADRHPLLIGAALIPLKMWKGDDAVLLELDALASQPPLQLLPLATLFWPAERLCLRPELHQALVGRHSPRRLSSPDLPQNYPASLGMLGSTRLPQL